MSGPSRVMTATETALRRLALVLLLALPCAFGPATAYLVMIIALLTGGLMLVHRKTAPVQPDRLSLIFAGVFLALGVLYTITAQAPKDILYVSNFLVLLLYLPLLWLFGRASEPHRLRTIALLALAGVIIAVVVAVIETKVLGGKRAGDITSDPIRFGAVATILGFIALFGLRFDKTRWRAVYLLGPVLAVFAVYLSGSRGSMAAYPVLALLATFLLVERKRLAALIAVGFIAAFSLGLYLVSTFAGGRASSLVDVAKKLATEGVLGDRSMKIRLDIYSAGLRSFSEAPIFGHGWARLTRDPAPYFHGPGKLWHYSHLHNDMLDFAVAAGVFGVVLYVALIVGPTLACLKTPRDRLYPARLYGCVMLSASYFLLGSTSLMLGFEFSTAMYVGLSAVMLGYLREPKTPASPLTS